MSRGLGDVYKRQLRTRIIDHLRDMPFAPSVQHQQTPRYSFNPAEDLSDDEDSDIDERISQHLRDTHTQLYGDELSDDDDDDPAIDADLAALRSSAARTVPAHARAPPAPMMNAHPGDWMPPIPRQPPVPVPYAAPPMLPFPPA